MEAASDAPNVSRLRAGLPKRLRAVAIHLAISAALFALALYLILVHWYPGFHFWVDGGWQGVRIMAAVDFVLGPLLTLIIFNPFKARHLIAFDLSCIAVAQLAALVWGFYAIHGQHPLAVSFYDGDFYPVPVEPLRIEKTGPEELARLSDRRPALVYVMPPANEDEEARVAMQELVGGVMAHEDPFFFRRFADHWAEVRPRAHDAARRERESAAFARELSGFLAAHGGQAADYAFFPYQGRFGTCTLAFTPAGEPAGALGCERI